MVEVTEAVARAIHYSDDTQPREVLDTLWPECKIARYSQARAAIAAMTAASPPVKERGAELLRMWRDLVIEGGVPRYTVLPGAVLNTLVTWTDAALANQEKTNG